MNKTSLAVFFGRMGKKSITIAKQMIVLTQTNSSSFSFHGILVLLFSDIRVTSKLPFGKKLAFFIPFEVLHF